MAEWNVAMLGSAAIEEGKCESVGHTRRSQERRATKSVLVWCRETGEKATKIRGTAPVCAAHQINRTF